MTINGWKRLQTSSGYYKKYKFGVKYIKFKFEPKNKIAGKWSVHYFDNGSGSGYLIKRGTLKQVRESAKQFMRKH